MDERRQVVEAAEARSRALVAADAAALRRLLHDDFRWTSHLGTTIDRDAYVERNTGGAVQWRSQRLDELEVVVVGETAVLRATVTDVVRLGDDEETFRMPMTQVWVRSGDTWVCLAGHAGPRLT